MNSQYEVSLGFYKEMKYDVDFASYNNLCCLAREMIYYNYLSDQIMSSFLNSSNDDIWNIINNIHIVSVDEFIETGKF
jgi:short subunit fatty acids transporter